MPVDLALALREIVDRESSLLIAIGDTAAAEPPPEGGWSRKEELGHLIDSAANNHIRFTRAALEGRFEGPGYDQNGWVRLHGYARLPWTELVELWRRNNWLLEQVIERIPEETFGATCLIGSYPPFTLRSLIEDYMGHLQHHLDHVLGRRTTAGA